MAYLIQSSDYLLPSFYRCCSERFITLPKVSQWVHSRSITWNPVCVALRPVFPILLPHCPAFIEDKSCSYDWFLGKNIWAFSKWISEPEALSIVKEPDFVHVKLSHLRKELYLSHLGQFWENKWNLKLLMVAQTHWFQTNVNSFSFSPPL